MLKRVSSPLLLLITAPSGAGKTTVGRNLLTAYPTLDRAITCTTRKPRPGERDGLDYHFLDLASFERRIAAGDFLEHAQVYGNHYGTLRSEVLDRLAQQRDVLLIIDVQGAETIRATALEDPAVGSALVSVFLMPPSLSELERRLRGRNQDSIETIQHRLAEAREEMEHWRHFDYVIVSGGIEEDLAAMRHVLSAEKLRGSRTQRLLID